MTATLFVTLLITVAAAFLVTARRYLSSRAFWIAAVGLPLWLIYVGVLSAAGVVRNAGLRPPGIVYVFLPVLLFMVLFAVRSRMGGELARRLPLALLMGAQVFRVPVEIGLHRLWVEGLVPSLLTYEGGNVDIVMGLSAPLMAWLWAAGKLGSRAAMAWNAMGLLALLNVATRAVLTAPGPLHVLDGDVANLAIGQFPYTYLAGFFAPAAVFLHILSIRALKAGVRDRLPAVPVGGSKHERL